MRVAGILRADNGRGLDDLLIQVPGAQVRGKIGRVVLDGGAEHIRVAGGGVRRADGCCACDAANEHHHSEFRARCAGMNVSDGSHGRSPFKAVYQRSYETPGTACPSAPRHRGRPSYPRFRPLKAAGWPQSAVIALGWFPMNGPANATMKGYAGGLTRRQFFAVVCLFWLYVTISNVLYAYGMRSGVARMTNLPLFAPWDARVLQHLLLLPFLLVSYWASLRIQWRPLWVAIPLPVILGLLFAGIAYPAMIAAQATEGGTVWHEQMAAHAAASGEDPYFLSLWLASFVSFIPTYGFGFALVTGLVLYTRFRGSELQRAALEREWGGARLAALRVQLSPPP